MPKKNFNINMPVAEKSALSGMVVFVDKHIVIFDGKVERSCAKNVSYPDTRAGDIVVFHIVAGTIVDVSFERRPFTDYVRNLYEIGATLPERQILSFKDIMKRIFLNEAVNLDEYNGAFFTDQLYLVK